jgi:hypothetical protein
LAGKRVELLKTAHPSIARVGLLLNMDNPVSPPQWEAHYGGRASACGRIARRADR